MSKFAEVAEDRDLTILTKEQREKLLLVIQRHGYASARNVAFDSSTFMYEGGNLDYYTGLSYETPEESYEGGRVKIFVAGDSDDDRTMRLAKQCRAIVKGEDPEDVDEG